MVIPFENKSHNLQKKKKRKKKMSTLLIDRLCIYEEKQLMHDC